MRALAQMDVSGGLAGWMRDGLQPSVVVEGWLGRDLDGFGVDGGEAARGMGFGALCGLLWVKLCLGCMHLAGFGMVVGGWGDLGRPWTPLDALGRLLSGLKLYISISFAPVG